MEVILAFSLAFLIGMVHFFGEELDSYFSKENVLMVSFSAGFTVAYFFLTMLPEISNGVQHNQYEFLFALAGFSVFYVLEEVIYEAEDHLNEIRKDFKELHTVFIFSYHLAIGFLLYFLINQSINNALLFFLPVIMHTAVNSVAIKEMHEEILGNFVFKFLTSFSAVIGVLIAYIIEPAASSAYILFGFIGGMFMYVVVHDALSPQRERPLGFIIGILLFILLTLIL